VRVCLSVRLLVEKRLIGSRCGLIWWVGKWIVGDRSKEGAILGVDVGRPVVAKEEFVAWLCKTASTDRAAV